MWKVKFIQSLLLLSVLLIQKAELRSVHRVVVTGSQIKLKSEPDLVPAEDTISEAKHEEIIPEQKRVAVRRTKQRKPAEPVQESSELILPDNLLPQQQLVNAVVLPVNKHHLHQNEHSHPLVLHHPIPLPPPPPPKIDHLVKTGEKVTKIVTHVGTGLLAHSGKTQAKLVRLNQKIQSGAMGLHQVIELIQKKKLFFLSAKEKLINLVHWIISKLKPLFDMLKGVFINQLVQKYKIAHSPPLHNPIPIHKIPEGYP